MIMKNNLKIIRQNCGYSQIQLAELLNVSRATIINIEMGHTIPNIEMSLKIARVLCVFVEDIFYLN